ncbi:MAG: hypothetical protein ACR2OC_07475 [Solirubrobacterales bacterium]
MSAPLLVLLVVLSALAAVGFGPALSERLQRLRDARARTHSPPRPSPSAYDPGRERRAELKALDLLRAAIGEEEYAMYTGLGFLRVLGTTRDEGGYGYLTYPHRPLVAYDTETDELLSEYCVGFPDRAERAFGSRLPDADDVLAKWMSLHGDERGLIAGANMHLPGKQLDPGQVKRDLRRMREWESRLAVAA